MWWESGEDDRGVGMRMKGVEEEKDNCHFSNQHMFCREGHKLTWKSRPCTGHYCRPFYLHCILIRDQDIEREMQHCQTYAPEN
jgi:hypothetical protein